MNKILIDQHKRAHDYLRISLTERCNLRCTYCMPEEGNILAPKASIMTTDEIYDIAKIFVDNGVKKIRLTGGEPLIRKNITTILERLATLPIDLAITTNAVIVDRFIETFKKCNIKNINVSLDTLDERKFQSITRRNDFKKVYENILLLVKEGFNVKLNAVLVKGFSDDEIVNFIKLTKELPMNIRFIEFMPFDGNKWDMDKMISHKEVLDRVKDAFSAENVVKIEDEKNDTSKNYQIKDHKGSFAIIPSVTNPFCDTCNRLRLTADGQLKNCLFSNTESDLLTPFRAGEFIEPIIESAVQKKLKMRGGMDTLEKLQEPKLHTQNRSMTTIGG